MDEDQRPATSVLNINQQQPKTNNFVVVLLSILLVISLGVITFLALQTQKLTAELKTKNEELKNLETTTQEPPAEPTIEPTTADSSTVDPAANWKTYTYELFTIKFPSEWFTTSIKNPIQFLNYTLDPKSGGSFNPSTDKGKLKVEIYQNSTSDSLESYLAQQKSGAIEIRGNEINWQETKAVVAGKEAVRVKATTPGFTYNFKDVSSNTIFSIAFVLDFDNYRELSDQILSTFKFIN